MARIKRSVKPLATIWNCPDDLWDMIQPVLQELDPPHKGHRQRTEPRPALDGIIYQMRSGCQWNQLPKQFGDDSSVHRAMQRWIERGVFQRIWALLVESCQELAGVDWEWQSADGAMANGAYFNVTFQRLYRSEDGQWLSTSGFGQSDLLVLAKLADAAHTRVLQLIASEQKQQRLPPKAA